MSRQNRILIAIGVITAGACLSLMYRRDETSVLTKNHSTLATSEPLELHDEMLPPELRVRASDSSEGRTSKDVYRIHGRSSTVPEIHQPAVLHASGISPRISDAYRSSLQVDQSFDEWKMNSGVRNESEQYIVYRVTEGDTLEGLAAIYFGDESLASAIVSANDKLGSGHELRAGMQIQIPIRGGEKTSNLKLVPVHDATAEDSAAQSESVEEF